MTEDLKNGKDVEGNDLDPCPFCGSDTAPVITVIRGSTRLGDLYTVRCDRMLNGCGATGGQKSDLKAAVQAWNTRVKSEKM